MISTYKEPVPGWTGKQNIVSISFKKVNFCTNVLKDNLYGPSGIISGTARGYVQAILGNRSKRANLVPADWVVNAMISCAWDTHQRFQSILTISIILMFHPFAFQLYVDSKVALKTVWKFLFITIFMLTTI